MKTATVTIGILIVIIVICNIKKGNCEVTATSQLCFSSEDCNSVFTQPDANHNNCSNILFESLTGNEAIIDCNNGKIEVRGDMSTLFNTLYDHMNGLPMGSHTKPIVLIINQRPNEITK